VETRDYVTLTGPPDSGKSTTLKLIAGLISPTSEASCARINTQVS
jgi:ABC-type sugar transport system ATPase subunit